MKEHGTFSCVHECRADGHALNFLCDAGIKRKSLPLKCAHSLAFLPPSYVCHFILNVTISFHLHRLMRVKNAKSCQYKMYAFISFFCHLEMFSCRFIFFAPLQPYLVLTKSNACKVKCNHRRNQHPSLFLVGFTTRNTIYQHAAFFSSIFDFNGLLIPQNSKAILSRIHLLFWMCVHKGRVVTCANQIRLSIVLVDH